MRPRVAFYPCCDRDIEEPLTLLKPFVDDVIFCDINSSLLPRWRASISSLVGGPNASFRVGDVRQVISTIEIIDVLFYRGDSAGEGGSSVFVLGDSFLPSILERFHPEGGLIITDGSNSRGSNFERMIRKSGMKKHGWSFHNLPEQPYVEHNGLHIIKAMPIPAAQPVAPTGRSADKPAPRP